MNISILLISTVFLTASGLDYDRYYGDSLLKLLASPWGIRQAISPLFQIFHGLQENFNPNSSCHRDLEQFRTSLKNSDEWAVLMADSSGGFLSGSLSGNLINLGSFDECRNTEEGLLPGKYCWLRIHLHGGVHQNTSFIPHDVPIRQSLCVPSTCGSSDIEELVQSYIAPNSSVSVTCQDPLYWGPWEIFGVLFFSFLFLAIVLSTVYDKFLGSDYEGYRGLWSSFSIIRNIKTFTVSHPNKISSVDGLRVLSQCIVIMYHVWRDDLKNEVPVYNKFILDRFIRTWEGTVIVSTTLMVDTFTVISGFLVMYSILAKDGKKINMVQHLLSRFMRLYPTYFIGLILMLTLAGAICDGPLCDGIILKRQAICRDVWWTNVLCINNIYPGLIYACMSHTWYVAADLQLFMFLSPLIIVGWRENKFVTIWAIVGTICTAVVLIFVLTVAKDLRTENLLFDRVTDAQVYYDTLYTEPYSRLPPWGIGLLFGIVMDNQKRNSIILKEKHAIMMWVVCGATMVLMLVINMPFQQEDNEYSSVAAGLYNALSKPIWCCCICWIIFACSSGYGGPLNDFLSSKMFQLLGKLSYSAYVVHKIVVNLYFSSLRSPIYISTFYQVTLMLGLIAQSFLAAFVFYLVAEMPFVHITKFILQKDRIGLNEREPTESTTSAFENVDIQLTSTQLHLSNLHPDSYIYQHQPVTEEPTGLSDNP